jgi:hypothetical protein
MNGPFPEHVHADHRETPAAPASELPGQLIFASAEEQEQRSAELLGAGAALVTMLAAPRSARGHLGEILEELVERELARLGAPSPYLSAWSATPEDAYARLADQLFRAKSVGSTGLAIALGSLVAIARPQLTPEDSATLRWLADITRTAPLVLLIDDGDAHALGYGPPLPLGTLLSGPPCDVHDAPDAPAFPEPTLVDAPVALAAPLEETPPEDARPGEPPPDEPPMMELAACDEPAPPPPPLDEPEALPAPPEPPEPRTRARRRAERSMVGIPRSGANDAWRTWTIALSGARGAQPLAAFERLFADSYVPLANAIASGLDDGRALRAYDEFRRSFERSYTDAFATFGATNRRPRLVMDAFDLAMKQARLAQARTAHVLVVDSLRFDLGQKVRDALATAMMG